MTYRKKKKNRVGALTAVLCVMLSLALAAGVVFGLYYYGVSRPAPASIRDRAALSDISVELASPAQIVTGEAPVPAKAELPEAAVPEEYGLEEILYDEDGLMVARIRGKRYVGFIAVVDDPLRLTLGKCPWFGEGAYGRTVKQMADEAGAVLAINGGGFSDPNGEGHGGSPTGNVIYEGKMLMGYWSPTVGIDAQGKLHVGDLNGTGCLELGLQWAVSYGPTLVKDGEICSRLDNSHGEPRTAIGQREDGAIVIVVLQGRQVQALGVTCRELAQIMLGYGCINASNLDGGASSDIYFQGEYLNACNTSGGPRPIPTSVLVMPAGFGRG